MMKEFKGTKGPWAVNIIGQHWNNNSLTHIEVTFGDDGECICDTVYQQEDANLIAAAPDLLEALQDLYISLFNSDQWSKRQLNSFSKARAAIAKALGETK